MPDTPPPAPPRSLPDAEPDAAHDIADHLDHFFRTVLGPDDSLRTRACFRYITGEPHPFGNFAIFARDADSADIAREGKPLVDCGLPAGIAFLNGGTPEQLDAVGGLGFVHGESMPVMSVTPGSLAETTLPDGYTFRQTGADEADAWARAVSDGYGLPLAVGSLFGADRAESRAPGKARFFAAEHKGQLVATSLLYLHDGLAGIYGVATLPEHRGKGLGAHLTAEPLRIAWRDSYTTGLLQASEMGAPVYTRIGFRTHGHMELVLRLPG